MIPINFLNQHSKLPIFIFILIILSSCKTNEGKKPSAFDLCMRNTDYIWNQDRCVPRDSLLTSKERCQQNNGYWDGKKCFSKDHFNTDKKACLERLGSKWIFDQTTNTGACYGPTDIDSSLAETCKQKGNYFSASGECVEMEHHNCLLKGQDYRWLDGKCFGVNEYNCRKRGFQRIWVSRSENKQDEGECVLKNFLSICEDVNAPDEVKHAIEVIFLVKNATSCQQAYEILKENNGISLNNRNLKTVMPLIEFSQLTSIWAQDNELKDLRVFMDIPHLTTLNLSGNQIRNLYGIQDLKQLEILYLADNEIFDLTDLSELKNLRELYLNSNQISKLSSLLSQVTESQDSPLAKLEILGLSDNCQLTDISGLERLPKLKRVFMQRTQVPGEAIPEKIKNLETFEHSLCI